MATIKVRLIANVTFDYKAVTVVSACAVMVHGDSRGTASLDGG